jgi:hypothetical protein
MGRKALSEEEKEEKKKERNLKNAEYQRGRRAENGEVIRERDRIYYAQNREKKLAYNKSEKRQESIKAYREANREQMREYEKEYEEKNKERIAARRKEHDRINRDRIYKRKKDQHSQSKIDAFNILGGCKCSVCGDINLSHLTIDHVNNDGHKDRKRGLGGLSLYRAIINGKFTQEELQNLRVLCWNHNSGRTREYLDIHSGMQTKKQRWQTKLWKAAFKFFDPCPCGVSDLKFLTISHINNDGAEKRRNGEKKGVALLVRFREQNWPEFLKETYMLECFNCNCSRGCENENFTSAYPSDSAEDSE